MSQKDCREKIALSKVSSRSRYLIKYLLTIFIANHRKGAFQYGRRAARELLNFGEILPVEIFGDAELDGATTLHVWQ